MKKCLLILVSAVTLLTGCATTNGLKKEKTDSGVIKYSDIVTETIKYEHPALATNSVKSKFNLHRGSDAENLNAYIINGQFFLEAAYECKSPDLLKINSIVFIGDEKLVFKKTRVLPTDLDIADYHYEELINPYFSYTSVNNFSYEDFKVMLTKEDVEMLSRLLESPSVYVSFVGERGRTDLYKMSKKVKIALRTMIEKYEYLLYGEPELELESEISLFAEDLEEEADSDFSVETSEQTEEAETAETTSEENTTEEGAAADTAVENKETTEI